jgi:hypothetical protein
MRNATLKQRNQPGKSEDHTLNIAKAVFLIFPSRELHIRCENFDSRIEAADRRVDLKFMHGIL